MSGLAAGKAADSLRVKKVSHSRLRCRSALTVCRLQRESSQMSRIKIDSGLSRGQDAEKTRAVVPEFKSISPELSAEI